MFSRVLWCVLCGTRKPDCFGHTRVCARVPPQYVWGTRVPSLVIWVIYTRVCSRVPGTPLSIKTLQNTSLKRNLVIIGYPNGNIGVRVVYHCPCDCNERKATRPTLPCAPIFADNVRSPGGIRNSAKTNPDTTVPGGSYSCLCWYGVLDAPSL